jgi:hypothetical protein
VGSCGKLSWIEDDGKASLYSFYLELKEQLFICAFQSSKGLLHEFGKGELLCGIHAKSSYSYLIPSASV